MKHSSPARFGTVAANNQPSKAAMAESKTGLWLVGARGSVATTVTLGLNALLQDTTPTLGLVTETALCEGVDFTPWDQFVVGGHEVRGGSLAEAATELEQAGVVPPGAVQRSKAWLVETDARIRPGISYRSGGAIEQLADPDQQVSCATPREAIDRFAADLRAFREAESLQSVVVVLLSSVEPPVEIEPASWAELEATLESADDCPLRASSLYAIAAIEAGAALVNFTPSLGAGCRAIEELAQKSGVPHCGADGKTGETLLKSVLAPMFSARNLQVDSWVGHNLLGNRDGAVLADAEHKQGKLDSKQKLLGELLGYQPQSHVSIESIESLGEWKTAWDHVHFRGFLGVPMTLQFTWQGCDSALAAPLVLDLTRLIDLAHRRGESGAVEDLAAFFKSPLGENPPHAFSEQLDQMRRWLRR